MLGLLSFFVLVALLSRPGHCFFLSFLLEALPVHSSHGAKLGRILYFPSGKNQDLANFAVLLAGLLLSITKTGLVCFCYFGSPAFAGDNEGAGWLVEVIGRRQQAGKYIFGGCASVFACIVIPGPLTFGVLWCQGDHWMEETGKLGG